MVRVGQGEQYRLLVRLFNAGVLLCISVVSDQGLVQLAAFRDLVKPVDFTPQKGRFRGINLVIRKQGFTQGAQCVIKRLVQ